MRPRATSRRMRAAVRVFVMLQMEKRELAGSSVCPYPTVPDQQS